MKQVYTNQNIALVGAIRSFLSENGIDSEMRNEFSSSVMGEVAFFDVWPEVWVKDQIYDSAADLISDMQALPPDGPEWNCAACQEVNPGNFEVCWSCGHALMK